MNYFRNLGELISFDAPDEGAGFPSSDHAAASPGAGLARPPRKASEGPAFRPIPKRLSEAQSIISHMLNADKDPDAVIKRIACASGGETLLVYISGMADESRLGELVIKPLEEAAVFPVSASFASKAVLHAGETSTESDLDKAVRAVLHGAAALFFEGETSCLIVGVHGFERRSVGRAENEQTVLGPKESFTECLKTDISLIRRHIASERLICEQVTVSNKAGTCICLLYYRGAADEAVINSIRQKLLSLPENAVLTTGTAEQLIFGNPLGPLPRALLTERPDRAASHILNGRAAILIDGSPEALILPVTLFSLMNTAEDVYMNRAAGTLLRLIRYTGALVSVLMPGYFLALALYHQGILSTEVLSTVIASRRMVFEPIGVELILLLIIFQLIREAGQRVPGSIGQAIGIIGGLIMGQAAVAAHLASSVVLIIVAASGLGNFCIPDYRTQLAAAYLRMAFVIAAWLGGLLAMSAALLVFTVRLADITCLGMPFLAPFAPRLRSARSVLVRGPITGNSSSDPALDKEASL